VLSKIEQEGGKTFSKYKSDETKARNYIQQKNKYLINENQQETLNKDVAKAIRKDIRKYNKKWITKIKQGNENVKIFRNKLMINHQTGKCK